MYEAARVTSIATATCCTRFQRRCCERRYRPGCIHGGNVHGSGRTTSIAVDTCCTKFQRRCCARCHRARCIHGDTPTANTVGCDETCVDSSQRTFMQRTATQIGQKDSQRFRKCRVYRCGVLGRGVSVEGLFGIAPHGRRVGGPRNCGRNHRPVQKRHGSEPRGSSSFRFHLSSHRWVCLPRSSRLQTLQRCYSSFLSTQSCSRAGCHMQLAHVR